MYTLSNDFSGYIQRPQTREQASARLLEVVDIMCQKDTKARDIDQSLAKYRNQDADRIKIESIDFMLGYAHYILEDSAITEMEAYDFSALKRVFRIKEGEFLQYRSFQVREILKKEFIRIYSDHFVDRKEELQKVNLQALFDLSYDQFEEMKKDEVINALLNGANPSDLDIAKLPKGFKL